MEDLFRIFFRSSELASSNSTDGLSAIQMFVIFSDEQTILQHVSVEMFQLSSIPIDKKLTRFCLFVFYSTDNENKKVLK